MPVFRTMTAEEEAQWARAAAIPTVRHVVALLRQGGMENKDIAVFLEKDEKSTSWAYLSHQPDACWWCKKATSNQVPTQGEPTAGGACVGKRSSPVRPEVRPSGRS